ncbi:EboA domain-containing protein [Maribacter sp. 2304DJ31-5]
MDSKILASLESKLTHIISSRSVRELYMTYSLLARDFGSDIFPVYEKDEDGEYLSSHNADLLEVSRIYLLSRVLEGDKEFFSDKVANIIQVADTGELETFLKFLILLPGPETFKETAVAALRTNISTVFDAITLNNPYPAKYFNDQQWNQMYLKAAFMERDLSLIHSTDQRANEDLARIISDYAHERWAASRKIDPVFWRPVTKFLNSVLLSDMRRLLNSDDIRENSAAALCCFYSENKEAFILLEEHKALVDKIRIKELTWNTVKS